MNNELPTDASQTPALSSPLLTLLERPLEMMTDEELEAHIVILRKVSESKQAQKAALGGATKTAKSKKVEKIDAGLLAELDLL